MKCSLLHFGHALIRVILRKDTTCHSQVSSLPIQNALDNVLKMQGVTYYWKVDEYPNKHFPEGEQVGFIAQEIEKVYPQVVLTDKDGYKSVDYSKLTPVLVEAIKEQQKIIEELQKVIQQLQEENSQIKQANAQLSAEIKCSMRR